MAAEFDAVLIAGPTASGKSALAIDLAGRLNGALINADSMQVYRDLRVLSARPSLADVTTHRHQLYGHVDAADRYSVGRWLGDVAPVLQDATERGETAIVVGGTGLYLKGLEQGLSEIPEVPAALRAAATRKLEELGPAGFHAALAARDPAAGAALRAYDPAGMGEAGKLLADVTWCEDAYSAIEGADALVITGRATGQATELADVKAAKLASGLPVVVGSGLRPDNAAGVMEAADGAIVGSWYKEEGDWRRAPDPRRLDELMRAVDRVRLTA